MAAHGRERTHTGHTRLQRAALRHEVLKGLLEEVLSVSAVSKLSRQWRSSFKLLRVQETQLRESSIDNLITEAPH